MSKVVVMDHPLIQHKIGIMRRTDTGSKDFRTLVSEVAMLECYEATRDLKLTDAGADDFNEEDDSFEITTAPEDFSAVREALEAENIAMASAEVTMLPQTYVTLNDENDIKQLQRTLDLLDEDDDVQYVYHNWDE